MGIVKPVQKKLGSSSHPNDTTSDWYGGMPVYMIVLMVIS